MTDADATKRPWICHANKITSASGDLIGLLEANDGLSVEYWRVDAANAAMIVKAVNNFDYLVAVAQMAANTAHRQTELSGRCVHKDCLRCHAESALHAALAPSAGQGAK